MASDYRRADTFEYAPGRFVEVGSKDTDVLVWEPGANVLLRFDGEARDKFMRAFAAAETDAERTEAAQAAATEDSRG